MLYFLLGWLYGFYLINQNIYFKNVNEKLVLKILFNKHWNSISILVHFIFKSGLKKLNTFRLWKSCQGLYIIVNIFFSISLPLGNE